MIKIKLKTTILSLLFLIIVGASFVLFNSYTDHKNLIEAEKERYPAPGEIVTIDGDDIHIYTEGEGDETLVFMSGLGTSSPFYDFKPLFDKLTDDYRIVVVERFGYGWSAINSNSRDIDTILSETRKALDLTGEETPYILIPHSISGLESIYWAKNYPQEVEAIIGLDPLTPEYAKKDGDPPTFSRLIDFLAGSGLIRNQPSVFEENFPAMREGLLTEQEAEVARSIFFRRIQTENMWNELEMVSKNADTVLESGQLEVPFYVLISNQNEDSFWERVLKDYAKSSGGEGLLLDVGHYPHAESPPLVAEKIKILINELKK